MPGHDLQKIQRKIPEKSLKGFTAYLKNEELTAVIVTEIVRVRERSSTGQLLTSRNEE